MLKVYRKKVHELEQLRKVTNRKRFLEGILVGAAVGAVVGLLLAPESGKEMVGRVGKGARGLYDKCYDKLSGCCCCGDDFESDFEDDEEPESYHDEYYQEETSED